MGIVYLGLIILIVYIFSKSSSGNSYTGGGSSGGSYSKHNHNYSGGDYDDLEGPGALPPDMYDPLYDYDNDGVMSEWEKCDQIEMWDRMWSGDDCD